jgi:hypothetical protein
MLQLPVSILRATPFTGGAAAAAAASQRASMEEAALTALLRVGNAVSVLDKVYLRGCASELQIACIAAGELCVCACSQALMHAYACVRKHACIS